MEAMCMSNVFSTSYPISRPTGVCASTGRPLVAGERFVAALIGRGEELTRADVSLDAWKGGSRPAGVFASWTTTFQPGADAKRTRLSDEEAAELFEQLSATDGAAQEAFRFILALFLVRRKLYVYEGSREGLMMIRPRTKADEPQAPTVEVREISMKDESLATALEQLKELIPDEAVQS